MASGSTEENQEEPASVRQKAAARIAKARKWMASKRPSLLEQIAYWALVVIGFVVGAYFLFGWMMGPTGGEKPERIDITRMALTVAAGFGGLVALVVSYRKQRDAEEGRFVERFGAAAEQLGHTDVAVRMAGVYAMAGVADRTKNMEQRQQCVDVLCGYLRLPYDPKFVENNQTMMIIRNPESEESSTSREIHFQYRQNDREVRNTIVRIIADHLRRDDSQSWSKCSFDFTGVFFEDGDFTHACFVGKFVSFGKAKFVGVRTSFEGATFGGERTLFYDATFGGEVTSFLGAKLDGELTTFAGATFGGQMAVFADAAFGGERTLFDEVTFGGQVTSFAKATFGAKETSFVGTTFGGGTTLFGRATFGGEVTSFFGATFSRHEVSFFMARFGARETSFNSASFSGEEITFQRVTFSGKVIDFSGPEQWSPEPKFDWDDPSSGILKPDNVKPHDWPPVENPDPGPGDS